MDGQVSRRDAGVRLGFIPWAEAAWLPLGSRFATGEDLGLAQGGGHFVDDGFDDGDDNGFAFGREGQLRGAGFDIPEDEADHHGQ